MAIRNGQAMWNEADEILPYRTLRTRYYLADPTASHNHHSTPPIRLRLVYDYSEDI